MTTLIYQADHAQRFWSIRQERNELHMHWGKVGSAGQHRTKLCLGSKDATREKKRLIKAKLRSGYIAQPSSLLASDTNSAETAHPPWLQETDAIPLPEHLAYDVLTHRHLPAPVGNNYVPMDKSEAQRCQQNILSTLLSHDENLCLDQESLGAEHKEDLCRAERCLREGRPFPEDSPMIGALLACSYTDSKWHHIFSNVNQHVASSTLMDAIVDSYGLEYAVELFIYQQNLRAIKDAPERISFHREAEQVHRRHTLTTFEMRLRFHLSQAEETLWLRCAQRLIDALPTIPHWRHPIVAILLPEKPELAERIMQQTAHDPDMGSLEWLKLTATHPETIAALKPYRGLEIFSQPYVFPSLAVSVLRERGVSAFPLFEGYKYYASICRFTAVMAQVNHPFAISVLLKGADQTRKNFAACKRAILLFPEAAIAAITEHLTQKPNKSWSSQLRELLYRHPSAYDAVRPWLSIGATQVLDQHHQFIHATVDYAPKEDLPSTLVNPPWLTKKKKKAVPELALETRSLPSVVNNKVATIPHVAANTQPADTSHLLQQMGYGLYPYQKAALPPALIKAYEQSDYAELKRLWEAQPRYVPDYDLSLLPTLPNNKALELWLALAGEKHTGDDVVMNHFGVDALEGFILSMKHQPQRAITTALRIGATTLAPIMARLFAKLKTLHKEARQWLLTYPEHAITGLLPAALGAKGKAREEAQQALLMLAENGHKTRILDIAARYERPDVIQAATSLLALDPLDNFPARRPALPSFYLFMPWHRPCLANGKALSDEALQHLGTMLRFPTTNGLYAGLLQVKKACTASSLASFAWDLFLAWLNAGAPPKESWAFTALGILGNDDTVRQLMPFMREWPKESKHKWAVTGLEIFRQIGSDIALMQLNSIAQYFKFKGLREKAQQMIAQIAEHRDLSVAELEDRLAPDLGLDKQGSLILDLGPRQFTVCFDEELIPFVRNMQGRRLKALPRPSKSDDPELSKEAVNHYKLLKKESREIAAKQTQRLEMAMCQQRRWLPEHFRQFLVDHPLVGRLTRRLVWATYNDADQLTHCFRVAEDHSYTTSSDEEFLLPEKAMIGLVHPAEISQQEAAAFKQLFLDYELLPAFNQLDRPCYQLRPDELNATLLERWAEQICPNASLMDLLHTGWRQGALHDNGRVYWLLKPMGKWTAIMALSKGLNIDKVFDEHGWGQSITSIGLWQGEASLYNEIWNPQTAKYPFKVLNSVAISELLSDIDHLFNKPHK